MYNLYNSKYAYAHITDVPKRDVIGIRTQPCFR